MNKNNIRIKRLVGIAMLSAITFILQFVVAGVMPKLPINGGTAINLALIPVVVGAILYGPVGGSIIGLVLGATTLLPGQGAEFFMVNWYMIIFTILLCLSKTGLAGLAAGYLFKLLAKKNYIVAIYLAAIITPIINTGIYVIVFGAFNYQISGEAYNASFVMIVSLVWIAFLLELAVNVIFAPALASAIKAITRRRDLGFINEVKDLKLEEDNNDSLS